MAHKTIALTMELREPRAQQQRDMNCDRYMHLFAMSTSLLGLMDKASDF